MKKIVTFIIGFLLPLLFKVTAQEGNAFQEQLQRLQSAITQSRQVSNPTGAPPTFNPNVAPLAPSGAATIGPIAQPTRSY
jgi:hypothetical protein